MLWNPIIQDNEYKEVDKRSDNRLVNQQNDNKNRGILVCQKFANNKALQIKYRSKETRESNFLGR